MSTGPINWRPGKDAPRESGAVIWAYLYESGVKKLRYWTIEDIAEEECSDDLDLWEAGFYEVGNNEEQWTPAWWVPDGEFNVPAA